MINYENGICAEFQPGGVQKGIIYLFAPAPILFQVLSITIIIFYPIDSATAKKNADIIKNLNEYVLISFINSIRKPFSLVIIYFQLFF
jgi:Na+/melibiose symporter-like transporter